MVGKGAGMLYKLLSVSEVYAFLISEHAQKYLASTQISLYYGEKVPAIINRDKTGFCPIESAVLDIFDEKEGVIDFNIRRVRKFKMEREAVPKGIGHGENSPEGIEAVTEYCVLREAKGMSLVRFIPVTGRTHQLRVHARAIGHPIIGDSLYSSPSPYISRQALHAERLSFIHPMTNEAVSVVCPLCEDLDICVKELFDE